MIRVYVSAPWPEREAAQRIATLLKLSGMESCARWIGDELAHIPHDDHVTRSQMDLQDVAACDVLLAYNTEKWANSGTGGRHVELGYAVAMCKPIVVYGDRTNVFHYLPQVTYVANPGDFIKAIEKVYWTRMGVRKSDR